MMLVNGQLVNNDDNDMNIIMNDLVAASDEYTLFCEAGKNLHLFLLARLKCSFRGGISYGETLLVWYKEDKTRCCSGQINSL